MPCNVADTNFNNSTAFAQMFASAGNSAARRPGLVPLASLQIQCAAYALCALHLHYMHTARAAPQHHRPIPGTYTMKKHFNGQ